LKKEVAGMRGTRLFERATSGPALIVYRDSALGTLWDPELSELTERLEGELGVFVTSAGASERSPDLRDAAAAARFAGCERAIVVTAAESPVVDAARDGAVVSGVRIVVASTPTWRVEDVARSYRLTDGSSARAA
jgi:hypothetical protein